MYIWWDGKRKLAGRNARELPPGISPVSDVARDPEQRATGWYELVDEIPAEYLERFPRLLGPSEIVHDEQDGRLHRRYLRPDFSPLRLREELTYLMKFSARHHLQQTDWMVVRQLEVGVPVPPEVRQDRARIRDLVRWYENQISLLPAAELPDYTWTFQAAHPDAPHDHPVDLPPGVVVLEMGESNPSGRRLSRAGGQEIPETPLPEETEAQWDPLPAVESGPDRRG